MKKIKCLNCFSENTGHYLMSEDIYGEVHEYLKCTNCELVFLWPLPDENMIKKIYNMDYYGYSSPEKFKNYFIVKAKNVFSQIRAKHFSKFLPENAKIIDVGCGNGLFLSYLHSCKKNFELHGIEIIPQALKATEFIKGKAWIHTITDIKNFFGQNSFNAVTYIHVFEHLTNPVKALDQLENIIQHDGLVMFVIPNIESKQAKKYKHNWFHLDPPRHIHFYPPKLLIDEMQKRNFKLMYTRYFDIEQNPYSVVQSILNCFAYKRDVLFERLRGNYKYAPQYKWLSVFFMKIFWISVFPFCIISDAIASIKKQSATVEMIFKKGK